MNLSIRRLGIGLILALGLPLAAQRSLHDLKVAPVAGQPTQLRLTYGPTTPDWIYAPQVSTDLVTWSPLTGFTQDLAGGVCTITDQTATGARRF